MTPELREKLEALVKKWLEQWAADEPDYYAGQYSRAEEHAEELQKILKEIK